MGLSRPAGLGFWGASPCSRGASGEAAGSTTGKREASTLTQGGRGPPADERQGGSAVKAILWTQRWVERPLLPAAQGWGCPEPRAPRTASRQRARKGRPLCPPGAAFAPGHFAPVSGSPPPTALPGGLPRAEMRAADGSSPGFKACIQSHVGRSQANCTLDRWARAVREQTGRLATLGWAQCAGSRWTAPEPWCCPWYLVRVTGSGVTETTVPPLDS